jgi:hypothetical protein
VWNPYISYVIGPVYYAIAFLFAWTVKSEASPEAQASV